MARRYAFPKNMEILLAYLFSLVLTEGPLTLMGGVVLPSPSLDVGYRQMYNLQFEEAHSTFQSWIQAHPKDPMGLTSDGAAYLFAEFDRLGVLQTELFVDNEKFKERQRAMPDPAAKRAFDYALAKSDQLADAVLQNSGRDSNALLSKVLNLGLRADYLALVEKRNLASLGYIKAARLLAEELLANDPTCYDAYLAVGVENYILGINPAPVRWLLRLYGAKTDKELGIKNLRLTAEKGHYLLPYARLLLAVAALRDKDQNQARQLLAGLSQEFPDNRLYKWELTRLQ
jgi:hypothetical protein